METSLYNHYKNKPYKFIGIARHSETLEEMALYEARYENKLGKLWVRPREMFFENVKTDGGEKPRFGKVEVTFSSSGAAHFIENKDLENLDVPAGSDPALPEDSTSRVTVRAFIENASVGVAWASVSKSGFFQIQSIFVKNEFRRVGIGTRLLEKLEEDAGSAPMLQMAVQKPLVSVQLLLLKNGYYVHSVLPNGTVIFDKDAKQKSGEKLK